jgi:probable phosphoglycerate mutase
MDRHATIWLLRHGESTWNATGRVQGQNATAGALSQAGERQAVAAAEALARRAPAASVVVTSDLGRAVQTARIIASRLRVPVVEDPGVREQALGALEGRSMSRSIREALSRLWDDPSRRPEGGESVAELYARIRGALIGIAARWPGGEVVLVTHHGPMRVALAACEEGITALRRERVANAGLLCLRVGELDGAPHLARVDRLPQPPRTRPHAR